MKILLIHWNDAEAEARINNIASNEFQMKHFKLKDSRFLKEIESEKPDAIVIDLNRLPSQGRDVALSIRKRKSTRFIPIIFIEGDTGKTDAVRKLLPDAVFGSWDALLSLIRAAAEQSDEAVVVPDSVFDGYRNVPLVQKLGLKPKSSLLLIYPPETFSSSLSPLPDGCHLSTDMNGLHDTVIWFARTRSELNKHIVRISGMLKPRGGLWIAWPKKAGRLKSDLNQTIVRKAGLENKLVDHKICSVDETWSALRFVIRKS